MQLTQQETNKIKQRDEQHTQELREWRSEIGKKKQVNHYNVWCIVARYLGAAVVIGVVKSIAMY